MAETSCQSMKCASAKLSPSLDRKYLGEGNITQNGIEKIAIEKFQSSGYGLTYMDVQRQYSTGKNHAQRNLKYLRGKKILFTSRDLIRQDIHLLANKKPQQYFPTCIKSEIIENLKRRKIVKNELEFQPLSSSISVRNPNLLQKRKAETFLDVLLLLPFTPAYIHRLFLILNINRQAYMEIEGKKKSEIHEEIIGQRYVKYILSSNGTIQIAVRSNDVPFKIESEIDENIIFVFFGQVKDRLLYFLGDAKELVVPPVMEWTLQQCDFNKDVEIDEKAQLTLPDIQLKYACRVFREYVKIIQDKVYYRVEESIKVNQVLPDALDNIRHPFKSIENKIDALTRTIKSLGINVDQPGCHNIDSVEKQGKDRVEQVDKSEEADGSRGGDM
jgi:hypothetical protein